MTAQPLTKYVAFDKLTRRWEDVPAELIHLAPNAVEMVWCKVNNKYVTIPTE